MKATVTLAVRCLHSTQEPVMVILSLTTSTILAQDSKNWLICTERNQTRKTSKLEICRHLLLCHRNRGVSTVFFVKIIGAKITRKFGVKILSLYRVPVVVLHFYSVTQPNLLQRCVDFDEIILRGSSFIDIFFSFNKFSNSIIVKKGFFPVSLIVSHY